MNRRWVSGVGLVLVALSLWEVGTRLADTPSYLIPSPSDVLASLVTDPARLLPAAGTTLGQALAGLLLGGAMGLGMAAVITFWSQLEQGVMSLARARKSW